MAIPIERTCEIYTEANKDNEISDFFLNYVWCEPDKTLSLDISDDRVSYQDFMIDLIKAAHMDFDSNFYNHYVKLMMKKTQILLILKNSANIKDTKLEKYINLLVKADLIDEYSYENGSKLHHTEVSLVPTQHFSFQEFWDVRMTMRRFLITI